MNGEGQWKVKKTQLLSEHEVNRNRKLSEKSNWKQVNKRMGCLEKYWIVSAHVSIFAIYLTYLFLLSTTAYLRATQSSDCCKLVLKQ